MKIFPILLFFAFSCQIVFGQSTVADFSIPSQACLQERIHVSNLSDLTRHEWDFCQGDLALTPSAAIVTTLPGNITTGIDIVFDGVNWFGFVASRDDNAIIRLDFGPDLQSVPETTNLGNISNVFNKPGDIKIVYDNGSWYGFVYGIDDPVISRIDFGTDLANTTLSPSPITATPVVSGAGLSNGGFDMISNGSSWVIAYIQNPSVSLVRLTSVTAIPATNDKLTGIPNTIGSGLTDITLVESTGNFYAYVVAQNKTLQRYSFGPDVFSIPIVENLTSFIPTGSRPYGVTGGQDNGNHYLFISTLEGDLYRVDLGTDLSQQPLAGADLGRLSFLNYTLKARLVRHNSTYSLFSTDFSTRQLFRVNFPEPEVCPASLTFSSEKDPVIAYSTSGQFHVSLRSFDGGNYSETTKVMTITSDEAPSVDFSSENVCIGNPVNFTSDVPGTISQYTWDFDDGTSLTGNYSQTSHTFGTANNFKVKLSVESINGCRNFVEKELKIYGVPEAAFTSPAGLICSNNEFTFVNDTPDSFDGLMTYQWKSNNSVISDTRDLRFAFPSTGDYEIRLVASIPGCSSDAVDIITNVQTGPSADFNVPGNCELEEIRFENLSEGSIAGFHWTFGIVGESALEDPAMVFPPGEHVVRLKAEGTNGCLTEISKTIRIDPVPVVNFETLPELLCSGSVIDFTDLTQTPSGSTLATWNWAFGDGSMSDSPSLVQHSYIEPGTYEASLTLTTNFGCSGTFARELQINRSPVAVFSNPVACDDSPVILSATDAEGHLWFWKIGDKTYQSKDVTHTFREPGHYEVMLKVVAENGCETSGVGIINVPIALQPDFSVLKNCAGEDAIFTDVTSGADPVISRYWKFNNETVLSGDPVLWSWVNAGEKSVALEVTASSGCSYTINKTVTVVPMPEASFVATPEIGTPPAMISFTNRSEHSSGYHWNFGDGSSSDVASPEHTFALEGEFNVLLTAFNEQGCEAHATETILVSPPRPDVSIRAISTSDNLDGSIKVVITLENDGNTVLTDLPVYIDISGNLSLRELIEGPFLPMSRYNLTLSYGLQRSEDLTFVCAEASLPGDLSPEENKSCIQFERELLFLTGYPNPARENLTVEWIGKVSGSVGITILNSMGRIVREYFVDAEPGFNRKTIDVQDLQKGVYLLILEGNGTRTTQHIILSY